MKLSYETPIRASAPVRDVQFVAFQDRQAPPPAHTATWLGLPHEWAFGAFLLLMAARMLLLGVAGADYAAAFLMLFSTGIALAAWGSRSPTPLRWRIRLLWYPTAMGLSFYTLPGAIAALRLPHTDTLLSGWDRSLLGFNAGDAFTAIQTPLLSDLMMAAYVFFFYYLISTPAYYCLHHLGKLRSCFAGLFTIYALGFLGYSVLPAAGPHLALTFHDPLAAGPLTRLLIPPLGAGSNGIDAFPSIHVAVSAYLLGFDARHRPRRALVLLLPCALLWVSTLYLRYHYLVDVFAGAALALFGLAVSKAWERSPSAMRIERDACIAAKGLPQPAWPAQSPCSGPRA